jgi:predicted HTH transcriptional regulator
VVKRSDLFAFRNPGAMRMPVETALRGGVSDCRNRRLQDMLRYVGLGEQAGSGIPKIQSAWRTQHWRSPEMVESVEPYEQTLFTLRMASLLPAEVVQALERRFVAAFGQASEVQKLALVAAAVERSVTHARLRSMTDAHPRDVTVALSSIVQRGMLESGGAHKRTYYYLPPRAQRRKAMIQSAPSGGGVGNGRSRIGTRCLDFPRAQTATICTSSVMSMRSTVTSTPRIAVSKGVARLFSSRV